MSDMALKQAEDFFVSTIVGRYFSRFITPCHKRAMGKQNGNDIFFSAHNSFMQRLSEKERLIHNIFFREEI